MGIPADTIRLAIVEDDREVREGLARLIGASPGHRCVAACASAEEALAQLPALKPAIVLMDIGLPGMSGIDCIRALKRLLPETQIMMLTVFEDHDRIFQSLAAGASGYLLKQTPPARLIEAITDLHHGGSPLSAQIARRVVQAFQPKPAVESPNTQLSPRETEIIQLLAHGRLYKEIADRLKLSVETVRTHIRNIYQKLHVRGRTEAINKVFGRPAPPVP
ncbi:MAG: response regulator transcription factor [Verrucomicrobia bacterium]|nr:response regulator transcription factor [Verrucomicrobiota bacterium]